MREEVQGGHEAGMRVEVTDRAQPTSARVQRAGGRAPMFVFTSALLLGCLLTSAERVAADTDGARKGCWNASEDWSDVQGATDWWYGFRVAGGDFQLMDQYGPTGSQSWTVDWFSPPPLYWTSISPSSMHPNGVTTSGGRTSANHQAVLRWQSPISGTIVVTGKAAKGNVGGGNGVDWLIQHNGNTLFSHYLPFNDAVGTEFNLTIGVDPGDTVDFVVDPHNGNDLNDSTTYTASIYVLGTAGGADLNRDCHVDGADLGMLLSSWGTCISAPANDSCADALPIDVGTHELCTLMATTEGLSLPESSCGQATQIHKDVWFRYTPIGDGELTVSTCGIVDFDSVIAIYAPSITGLSGCPTNGISLVGLVECNDDASGCGWGSKLTIPVKKNVVYKIRVGGFNSEAVGIGHVSLDFKSVGSECYFGVGAPWGQNHVTITGTTLDNAPSADNTPCGYNDTFAEWITWTCTCETAEVTVSTCNPGTNFDTVLAVWEETFDGGCTAILKECVDDTNAQACALDGLALKSRITFLASYNRTYHIRVAGYDGAAGNYELTIDAECN